MSLYWHVHHDILLEPLTEPIEVRREYIRSKKPEHERELRLRLLKRIRGPLPDNIEMLAIDCIRMWDAFVAACAKGWGTADAISAYDKAWLDHVKAIRDHRVEIEKLHRQECPECPWDGKTIFLDFPEGYNEG